MNLEFTTNLPTKEGYYVAQHLNHTESLRVRLDNDREEFVVDVCGVDIQYSESLFRYDPKQTPWRWSQKLNLD